MYLNSSFLAKQVHWSTFSLLFIPPKKIYLVWFCKKENIVYQQHGLQVYNILTLLYAKEIYLGIVQAIFITSWFTFDSTHDLFWF
jgi:hypothetical protein